jgi:hypothetical protein
VAVFASVGCAPADANAPGIHLSAVLRGDDVTLTWDGHSGDVVVEFATEPAGRYTVLAFLPHATAAYEHPDLMPATTFYYRVRPVDGAVSARATAVPAVPVTGEDWLVPRTVPDSGAAPVPGGAPVDVVAASVGPGAVRLTWTDNATDEEGFLVERRVGDIYEVAFVVDPDVNYVGLIDEPGDTFRVRAYRYGASSNVVHEQIPG